jgi:cell division transport system ATP-binding protein
VIEGKEPTTFRRAQRVARVIRLNGIGLRYARGSEVLHDVPFHLRPGSFHFLTGPSGSGKTSLLRLLFMSIQPTRGAIHVLGQDIARVAPSKRAQLRRRIGIVFQDFRLLEHMTTWENIAMPLRVSGKRVSDYKEDVTDLLQWVGLGDRMHSYPSILSGGEKQRAAIARAVIRNPRILVLDDALASVDTQTEEHILNHLREVMKGRTTIFISHRVSTVRNADYIAVLHDGHIVEYGSHDELVALNGYYTALYNKQLLEEELETV